MTSGTKLSIAMAVYNGERFLAEQLESYLSQVRMPDELIVSDNASTDRTREIVQAFAASAPFEVRLIAGAENVGIAKNFERAISSCTGDTVFLSDCDDIWLPHKLARVEEVFLAEKSAGLLAANSLRVDVGLTSSGMTELAKAPRAFKSSDGYRLLKKGFEAVQYLTDKNISYPGHNLVLRSWALPYVLPFPPTLSSLRMGGHDLFLTWTLPNYCDVAVIGDPLVLYRQHSNQATAQAHLGLLQRRVFQLFDPWPAEALATNIVVRDSVLAKIVANDDADQEAIDLLSSKNLFERSRLAGWQQPRRSRIRCIAENLCCRKYNRFANGISTAIKDLAVRRIATVLPNISLG